MTASTSPTTVSDLARGRIQAVRDGRINLALPGTDYVLDLSIADSRNFADGQRFKGRIAGQALRMFATAGGGAFIEPAVGEPRIVAGRVLTVDVARRRILIEAVVPMWLDFDDRQPAEQFVVGELVNCYVASGISITPA